ncbi:MAG: NUDIX domain-containing protein [Bacteroidales bacterium]|nr:NUDIX domain-containing protein [Bacteroidales bacterium]
MDLVYPVSIAPLAPGCRTGKEMVPIVEPTGRVTARAPRQWCHRGSMALHPVVHLHIIDRYSRIYLQRRGASKSLLPLYWDTAVGGHVNYGEYLREALFREAGEELGFYDFNPVPVRTYIFESQTERELVNVFAAVGNFDLHPDGDEVAEGRWWEIPELEASFGKDIITPNFEQEFPMVKQSLLSLL